MTVEFASPASTSVIEGVGIPYGDAGHKDLHGEWFTPSTEFGFSWFDGTRPLIWLHGVDPSMGSATIGRIEEYDQTPRGIHWRARLNSRGKSATKVRDLVDRGAAGFSSGSVPHLVKTLASGEIVQWIWIEGSITATPANRDAMATSVKGLCVKSADSPVRFAEEDLDAIADRVRDWTLQERIAIEALYFDWLQVSAR